MAVKRRTVGLLSLAVVLGVGIILQQQQQQKESAPRVSSGARSVDYFIDNLQVTTMNKEGKPARTLQAQSLRHYKDDETTELDNPYLKVTGDNKSPWEVKSATGWVSADGELVILTGNVDIQRKAAADVRPLHLVTENLHIQPEKDYAETDAPVVISSDESTLSGTGMQAWLAHPARIKLNDQTRGHYVFN